MSLFVIPIAVAGLKILPAGSNPDLFVLSLPLSLEQDALAMFAFIGGFSSATSMVIVASLALATMVSNHIVMPIWIKWSEHRVREFGDVRRIILNARRFAILLIIMFGYIYYWATSPNCYSFEADSGSKHSFDSPLGTAGFEGTSRET